MVGSSLMTQLLVKLPRRLTERSFAAIFFVIGLVIPRSRRIWAFGSWYGRRFADNPKHFFLYCNSLREPPAKTVWISGRLGVVRQVRQLGLPAHHWLSPLGLWYSLRAGVYVVDCRAMDVSSIARSGAKVVNLWHGIPLKKIEGDVEQPDHPYMRIRRGSLPVRLVNRLRHPDLAERYDYVLSTSALTAARFQSAFGVAHDQVISTGYPRNDPLLARTETVDHLPMPERDLIAECQSHAREGRRVLLYMPTFRDWNNNSKRTIPMDWAALDAVLSAGAGVLYCKLHPADQASLPPLDGMAHIRVVSPGLDIYSVLRHTDALITDYSSIFFDYLLLDRPILFYPYDLDEYQRLSRALYDPYDEITPGPKARTAEELQRFVEMLLDRYPDVAGRWCQHRARVRSQVHDHVDDRASERLAAAITKRLTS